MSKPRRAWLTVKCPNCGLAIKQSFREGFNTFHCDPDEGGCDEPMSVYVRLVARVTTYRLEVVSND